MVESNAAYKEVVSEIHRAVQNPDDSNVWAEVSAAMRHGYATGGITEEGLKDILPEIGLSGDLVNSALGKMDQGWWIIPGDGRIDSNELQTAQNNSNLLISLAADIASENKAEILGQSSMQDRHDPWVDKIDSSETTLYAESVHNKQTMSVEDFAKSAEGTVFDGYPNGGGQSDSSTDAVTSVTAETDATGLRNAIQNRNASPQDRLLAAKYLFDKGEHSLMVKDGDQEYNVEIRYDNGIITLMANDGQSRPVLRGVIRGNEVSQQGTASYYGDRWSALHPSSIFSPMN